MFDRIKPVQHRVVGMTLFTLAIACGGSGGDSQKADSTAVADSAARARSTAANVDSAENDHTSPPELTVPLKDISSKDLRDHAQKHGFLSTSDFSGERDCANGKHSLDCRLKITGVPGTRHFKHTAMTRHGTVIARIENAGTVDEGLLGIKRKREYYWFVEKNPQGRSLILDVTGERPVTVKTLKFEACSTDATHPNPS
jgi:hypothetical protein